MARLLAHPLRLGPAGTMSTVDNGSDEQTIQRLAVLVGTIRGERELVPTFGISDPAFAGVDAGELAAQVSTFGPDIDLEAVDITYAPTGDTADIVITFTS